MINEAMRKAWEPLHSLHHAKRPVLVIKAGVAGSEKLAALLGIPATYGDWVLFIDSDQVLNDTIAGVEAVLSHDGQFPDFSEWRESVL